jgi:ribosome-associated protein
MPIRSLTNLMKNFAFSKQLPPLHLSYHHPTGNVSSLTFYSYLSSSTTTEKSLTPQQLSDEETKKRIQQSSEYFSQYIEEYYEEEEPEETIEEEIVKEEEPMEPIIKSDVSKVTKDELVSLLQEHRAQNIIAIDVQQERSPWTSLVICSPYNDRHGQALMQTVRKHIKTLYKFEDDQMPRPSKVTSGWFVFDMRNVLLHIMSGPAREKYQLEKLYSTNDEEENDNDESMIPPPSTQISSASTSGI